jgi:RHS repeat-associated protein
VAITDNGGLALETRAYGLCGLSPAHRADGPARYGEPESFEGSRFQYTGQIAISEVGLFYHKARFYAPSLGRFLQTDPLGYADGLNLYAYVSSDLINFTDPTGLFDSCTNTGAHDSQGRQIIICSGGGGGFSSGFGSFGSPFNGGGSSGGSAFGGGFGGGGGGSGSGVAMDTMSGGDIPCRVDDCITVVASAASGGVLSPIVRQLIQNILNGRRAEREVRRFLEGQQGLQVFEQVTFKDPAIELKSRIDFVVKRAVDGKTITGFIEVKSGNGTLSTNQKIVLDAIRIGTAIPVGRNAANAGFLVGISLQAQGVTVVGDFDMLFP